MKRYSAFLLLILFISLTNSFIIQAQNFRFVIKVISADRKEPIEGAAIKFDAKSTSHSEQRFETSDWEGMAYRDFDFYGTFSINAEAAGYYGTIQVIVKKTKDPSGDVPVTLILKRKAGVKLVSVTVFEKGTGALIYDAQVNLKGNNYSYNGSTNSMGEAIIAVEHGDDYAITVTHNGYAAVTGNVLVKQFDDDQTSYGLELEMVPTRTFKRVMYVKVQTLDEQGNIWGVPYASVHFTYEGTSLDHNADEEGVVEFDHNIPPGELVSIDVKMGGYKPKSGSLTIKANGVSGQGLLGAMASANEKDMIVFNLVKEKGLERTIQVTVKDNNGNPVKFADVNFPDDGLKITDSYGICSYTIKWPADESVKITAEKNGYLAGTGSARPRNDEVTIILVKKAEARMLRIDVRDNKGNPVPYANVSFPDGNSSNTNMAGHADYSIAWPTDKSVTIQVEKKGYKTNSGEAVVGRDHVQVILEKEADQSRTLHITVKDNRGQPVKYADLNFPDGKLKVTDNYGNCDYTIAWPAGEQVKIDVEKSGYNSKSVSASPGNNNITVILEINEDARLCSENDEQAFSKLVGTWKSYRMHITIGGSCTQVTGTWKVTEWCEGVDATYNTTTARINGTFTGRMKNGTLQVNYESPPSPNNAKGTKGTGSISIQSNGILSCSFGCTDGELLREK